MKTDQGAPVFYIPEYVKNDTAWIECPIEYELDKSGEKKKASGCGYQFKFSQRKRIKWDASKFICYDNQDVINKVFTLPRYAPLIADEAIRFACLTEDTLISMPRDLTKYPDGVPIKDLINKENFYVYSWNHEKDKLELSNCKGCFYVKDADVFEMELTTGEKIQATEDHKFHLMDGTVKEMKDLIWFNNPKDYNKRSVNLSEYSNHELENIKIYSGNKRYQYSDRLKINFEQIMHGRNYLKIDNVPKKRVQESRFIYQEINGEVNKDFIIHHKDENALNNNPENLKGMSWSEHSRLTAMGNRNIFVHRMKTNKIRQPKRKNPIPSTESAKTANESRYGGRIKSITYIGKKPVYSLVEVSKNHNYFGNMLLLSNSGMEHNHTESKELKKLFTVIRPKRFWIFFAIPSIKWVDSKYREGMASFWLRILERGVGVLFEADKGVTKDIWHLKELEAAMGPIKFFTPMDKIKRNLMKHPCYFDMFKFPDLDEKTYEDYELVRNAVNLQRQVEEQSLSNKDVAKIAAYNLVHNWERIAVAIQRSKENKVTAGILADEIFFNPVVRKRSVSDVTIRSWVRGVQEYIKTKGDDSSGFDGAVSSETVNVSDDKDLEI